MEQLHAELGHSAPQGNLAEVVRSLGESPGLAQRRSREVVRSVPAPTLPQQALATMRPRSVGAPRREAVVFVQSAGSSTRCAGSVHGESMFHAGSGPGPITLCST